MVTEEEYEQIARQNAMHNQMADTQTKQLQQQIYLEDKDRSMIKDQLDLTEELERIEHLLRGHILTRENDGSMFWKESTDDDMIILSEYGIHLIMNSVTWYINKNTLLSNYDDVTILSKMEDFATALTDDIFMEYEKVFQFPTIEECQKVFNDRMDYRTKMKVFTLELLGEKADKEAIRNEKLDEMEGRVEKEIEKIKEQKMKNKLKRFELLIRVVQDAVHSTYQRSWKGEERRTLREHIHISEARGGGITPMQQRGTVLNPLNWFKGR